MAYEKLEREARNLKGEIVNEIDARLKELGYEGHDGCQITIRWKNAFVWRNLYGNGIIVKTDGGVENHIDNFDIFEALEVLRGVLKAI